jgi:hypothetical protein
LSSNTVRGGSNARNDAKATIGGQARPVPSPATGPQPPPAWLVIMVRAWWDDEGLRIRLTAAGTGDGALYAATTRADDAAVLVQEWLHRLPGDRGDNPGDRGDGPGDEPDDGAKTPPA